MTEASVAVIGAGAIGASVAYHLAARGVSDVLLLDRSAGPGLGSTGAATGGFRAQFETEVNVRLSLLSRAKLLRFREETGGDCGYRPAGYLWLARSEAELSALRAAHRVQVDAGLTEAALVTLDDVARLSPAVDRSGILGGAFAPTDGFIRPLGILEGYLEAAERRGARVLWSTDVTGFQRSEGGWIRTVETSRGPVSADAVVNAAGAWAARIGSLAGVTLPVTPLRRQAAATVPTDVLPESTPMTIDVGDGFHFRVRDGRVLLLKPSPGAPGRPLDATIDPAWIEAVARIARERIPALRGVAIDRAACWAGLYEMSPDRHAILGPSMECPNLYLVNGSSGHGVMHAPALGQLAVEIILDGVASSLDVAPLRPSRFREGASNPASGLL